MQWKRRFIEDVCVYDKITVLNNETNCDMKGYFIMRIIHKILILSMLLTLAFSCSGCGQNAASGTSMEFSFNTSAPADSTDEKTIYICKDMEKLELNAKLTVDSGNVTVQVLDISSNETVWNHSYNENTNFKIELTDLKADNEYLLKLTIVQSKKVNLAITTEEKLVKDKDKPNKYNIEKE